jgi:hypothetical protein
LANAMMSARADDQLCGAGYGSAVTAGALSQWLSGPGKGHRGGDGVVGDPEASRALLFGVVADLLASAEQGLVAMVAPQNRLGIVTRHLKPKQRPSSEPKTWNV